LLVVSPVRRRVVVGGVVVVAVVAGSLAVIKVGDQGRSAPSAAGATVVVASDHGCALEGRSLGPGRSTVEVDNTGHQVTRVAVLGSGSQAGLSFGAVEMVAPATRAEMPVDLGTGTYGMWCYPGRGKTGFSASFQVTARPGQNVAPPGGLAAVTSADFSQPMATYGRFVGGRLSSLLAGLRPLRAAVAAGDLPVAEALYPVVHGDWERIGAVYNAFEPLTDAINGLPFGLPLGEDDPSFTGFHKLEAQLWGGATAAATLTIIDGLIANVTTLESRISVQPQDYVVRAHEILENALQEQVTGLAEPHSHTGIADAAASTQGAKVVWQTLENLVRARDGALADRIDAGFTRLDAVVGALELPDGRYPPDTALSVGRREALTGAMSALLENLDAIPGLIPPPPPPSGDQF
jgi:hypothetical protein